MSTQNVNVLNETFSAIFKHCALVRLQSKNSNNLFFSARVSKDSFFLASSGVRSPKQSVSESLPDEDQGQQEGQDAAATSPKPKVDEASKKGQSHQKSTFHNI